MKSGTLKKSTCRTSDTGLFFLFFCSLTFAPSRERSACIRLKISNHDKNSKGGPLVHAFQGQLF